VYIFDLDGTLIHNRAFRYAYKEIPKFLKININPEEFEEIFLNAYYEFVKAGKLKEAFDWDLLAKIALEKIGINCQEDVFLKLVLKGLEMGLIEIRAYAREILKEIRALGGKVIILTNGYRKYQQPALEKTRLLELIHILLTNDDLIEPKPSKKAFEQALRIINVYDLESIMFIGDHPYYDIYGALNAGIEKIVWITDHHTKGSYLVRELAEDIINYAKSRYDIILDLSKFWNKEIEIINDLRELKRFLR